MKHLFLGIGLMIAMCGFGQVVPIWGDQSIPGKVTTAQETMRDDHCYNVSVPTLELFLVEQTEKKPLPLVLVVPGGGYACQAYVKEGTEVAQWIRSLGVHAAVVKYRIPGDRAGALMDVREALAVVQQNAAAWAVDTTKIGMIGFSAGAHLTARVLSRPSHGLGGAMLIYPAYLSQDGATLAKGVVPSEPIVPTFVTQCGDDRAFVLSSLAYVGWGLQRNHPISYHLYARGGHGFGLRKSSTEEASQLKSELAHWLQRYLHNPNTKGNQQ